MKKILPLLFATLTFAAQPVWPADSESSVGTLPHAFDAGWQGQKTCEVLFENDTTRVGHCRFPPGVGHEKHYHNPHFGYVLEGGTLLIRDEQGERKVTTSSDGRWSTTSITVHEAVNIGATTTSYLIVESKNP